MNRIKKTPALIGVNILLSIFLLSITGCGDKLTLDTDLSSISVFTSESQLLSKPDWFTDYVSILDEYRRFVDYSIAGGIENVTENDVFSAPDNQLKYHWESMLIETNIWSYREFPKTRKAFGYAIDDLNADGQNELILLLRDYTILAIFTISESQPNLLDAFWPRHRCAINASGYLSVFSSNGATDWEYTVQQIPSDGSGILEIGGYGIESNNDILNYYKITNNERQTITEAEFTEFEKEYPLLSEENANNITKSSGITYYPLFD